MGRRRQILLMINEPAQVSSGLQPDRHSLQQPLWERAVNARFYQGKVRRLIPASSFFTANAGKPMRGIHQQQMADGTRTVLAAYYIRVGTPPTHDDMLRVVRYNGSTVTQILSGKDALEHDAGNGLTSQADFTTWGNWTVINVSGGEYPGGVPRLYDPSGALDADLDDAPADAVCYLKRANQLVAIGYGDNKRLVGFSKADDITIWSFTDPEVPESLELPLEDLNTPIRGAAMLGSNIAVYGEDQLALVYWTGAPFYWGRRIALDGIGLVGKMAVCADGPLNYGVSRNGIWVTDGNTYDYIDKGILTDWLEDNVNWDQKGKILAFRNDVDHCIEFHFPTGSSLENDYAWSFDPQTRGWSPVTAYQSTDERRLYDNCLVAEDGVVYLMDAAPGTAAALDLSTKPLLMQTPNGVPLHEGSYVDEIELLVKTADDVEFRYGVQEDMDGTYGWSEWMAISADMRTYQPVRASADGPMLSGIFHKLEFRSTATNWDIDLQGFILYGRSEGTKRDTL